MTLSPESGIMSSEHSSNQSSHSSAQSSCCSHPQRRGIDPKVLGLAALVVCLCLASYVFPFLVSFREHFWMYLTKVWWGILLGLLIGGWMEYYVSREYISYQLSRSDHQSILKSVALGFLMSACCHGIMAIAIQLYRKGASTSCVVAFLLASPWANLMWTIVLVGFFGWTKALFIVGVSLVIAIITGLIFQQLEKMNRVDRNPATVGHEAGAKCPRFWNVAPGRVWTPEVIFADIREVARGTLSLSNMVLLWVLLGITMASAIAAYVPSHIFHQYMGPTFLGMAVTLCLAIVVEVCSEGSTPLAFEIYRQTGALGNSLVFLLAGVATDVTEIGMLWQNIGRRTALWMPVLTIPQILFWGWVGNLIF